MRAIHVLRPPALRADGGHFAGQLARAAHDEHIAFAIGTKRIAPLWRLLAGIADGDWRDAIGMQGAQVTRRRCRIRKLVMRRRRQSSSASCSDAEPCPSGARSGGQS